MNPKPHWITLLEKARKTKNKRVVLNRMLADKKIPCEVEYRWKYKSGWYICKGPWEGQRIGFNFYGAKTFIEGKTLDFIMGQNDKESK